MAKTCPKCSFKNNPDDANYCGSCGVNIASQGHDWKLYNSTKYNLHEKNKVAIYRDEYNYFRNLERKHKNNLFYKFKDWSKEWWSLHDEAVYLLGMIAVGCCISYFFSKWIKKELSESQIVENSVVKENGDYELFKKDGRYNFKNADGKYLSNQWFNYAGIFPNGCAPIELNGKWNFINQNGEYISKEWFSNEYPFSEGWGAVENNNKWNYISPDGKYLSNNWYDQCYPFFDGWGRVKYEDKWNYVNSRGRFISDQWFEKAAKFNNGKAEVSLNGKRYYIDTKGNKVN